MKVVYGTPWIEVEFGQRDEGWKVYKDRQAAIDDTRRASAEGAYEGGYIGPVRPLRVYEIPVDCLEKETKAALKKSGVAWTSNHWWPKFKDAGTAV
jgi:hypothetical protein